MGLLNIIFGNDVAGQTVPIIDFLRTAHLVLPLETRLLELMTLRHEKRPSLRIIYRVAVTDLSFRSGSSSPPARNRRRGHGEDEGPRGRRDEIAEDRARILCDFRFFGACLSLSRPRRCNIVLEIITKFGQSQTIGYRRAMSFIGKERFARIIEILRNMNLCQFIRR